MLHALGRSAELPVHCIPLHNAGEFISTIVNAKSLNWTKSDVAACEPLSTVM